MPVPRVEYCPRTGVTQKPCGYGVIVMLAVKRDYYWNNSTSCVSTISQSNTSARGYRNYKRASLQSLITLQHSMYRSCKVHVKRKATQSIQRSRPTTRYVTLVVSCNSCRLLIKVWQCEENIWKAWRKPFIELHERGFSLSMKCACWLLYRPVPSFLTLIMQLWYNNFFFCKR
jgi:hypothetical protein